MLSHYPLGTYAVSSSHIAPEKSAMQPGQVVPARVMSDIIHAELNGLMDEAIAEAQEEMSLVLGGQMRDGRRTAPQAEKRHCLALLQQWISRKDNIAAVEFEMLLNRFVQLADTHDPLATLRQAQLDNGQIALILATLLSKEGLSAQQRNKLKRALYQLMEDETLMLSVFTYLELGAVAPEAFEKLKQIYQYANQSDLSLVEWFQKFRSMQDRQRKLKALLSALSFELSAQRPDLRDAHLAAVVHDLQKVMLFLGLAEQCQKIASTLALPNIDGDVVLLEVLTVVDQSWMSVDWLSDRCDMLAIPRGKRYIYVTQTDELIGILSEKYFRDDEQREMLRSAYAEYRDLLVLEEDA